MVVEVPDVAQNGILGSDPWDRGGGRLQWRSVGPWGSCRGCKILGSAEFQVRKENGKYSIVINRRNSLTRHEQRRIVNTYLVIDYCDVGNPK